MLTTDQVKRAILRKYDTLQDCAAEIGMSKSQFSRSVRKPSPKFLNRLEDIGVNIEYGQKKKASDTDKPEEISVVDELREIIYEKNRMIEEHRNIIAEKNKIINQYEELLEAAKAKK